MKKIYPEKLKKGDEIRIIAPSRSLGIILKENREIATNRLTALGFTVTFGRHVEELDEFASSSIESRVEDLHDAFQDEKVKGIFAVIGGFNCNQLLRYIDWKLIQKNPKVFMGFSDTTAIQNAMYTQTGLITYSGPAYSTFAQKLYFDYTMEYFKKCVMEDVQFEVRPNDIFTDDEWFLDQNNRKVTKNDGWWVINEGQNGGTILGANLCTLNLLQGTEYMPDIRDSILFLEDDDASNADLFDRDLQSLIHQKGFKDVRGIVIGRFQVKSKITRELLTKIIKTKKELVQIPIIANIDFGHTSPMITFPIGGEVQIKASGKNSKIEITRH